MNACTQGQQRLPENIGGVTYVQGQALQRFALMKVAGEFAVEFGILPFNMEEIDELVLSV